MASNACAFLSAFSHHIRATRQREVLVVDLDRSKPWGFFDGAEQNNVCGGGALLYLSKTHFFEMIVGLGEGSNNFAEIMSLKLLLVLAAEKGVTTLNFMGDSSNVIN